MSTWHYGLVADYWASVNLEAPELELYMPFLRRPVLDAGCGAGRLLAPLRDAGFDVDGCDVSADMVARCRERAPGATLWATPLHELAPPRRYASIVCSGVLGLGSTREQDERAIGRLHDALLSSRVDAVDDDDRCVHMTIRAQADGGRVEEHTLTMRFWYRDELVPLLERSGSAHVRVMDGIDENIVEYVASRDGDLQPLPR